MGLDNMPVIYPCESKHGAMYGGEEGCVSAMDADLCPWQDRFDEQAGKVVGMFGTPCWYRGKWGNVMLGAAAAVSGDKVPGEGFYGTGVDGNEDGLDPDECRYLSGWMRDHVEAYVAGREANEETEGVSAKEAYEEFKYAADWLDWVADHGGANAWW